MPWELTLVGRQACTCSFIFPRGVDVNRVCILAMNGKRHGYFGIFWERNGKTYLPHYKGDMLLFVFFHLQIRI